MAVAKANNRRTMTLAASNRGRGGRGQYNNNVPDREDDEFAGIYINIGLINETEDGPVFNRLPRGIAVSDLQMQQVYEATPPELRDDRNQINALIEMIQEHALQLEEGESLPLNFAVQMYRRNEANGEVEINNEERETLQSLFG